MTSAITTITAEELERMALGEQRVELVRGEVITMAWRQQERNTARWQ